MSIEPKIPGFFHISQKPPNAAPPEKTVRANIELRLIDGERIAHLQEGQTAAVANLSAD
jgi:hypothetical protein